MTFVDTFVLCHYKDSTSQADTATTLRLKRYNDLFGVRLLSGIFGKKNT